MPTLYALRRTQSFLRLLLRTFSRSYHKKFRDLHQTTENINMKTEVLASNLRYQIQMKAAMEKMLKCN